MNKPFRNEKLATCRSGGYITPEKLTTLKMIFDAVCDELTIPMDATSERELLATRIMVMGQTVESEMILVTTAVELIAGHRQELSNGKSSKDINLEPQTGYEQINGTYVDR
jgi:hypothetical protein